MVQRFALACPMAEKKLLVKLLLLSSAESNQRLIAWNFASSVVPPRANRKFPRRYFSRTEGLYFLPIY